MKKVIWAALVLFFVLGWLSLSQASQPAKGTSSWNSFSDHFDGNQVDSTKWIVEENTNLSGLPAFGGSVTVGDSQVTLASTGDGTSFPCVTSVFSPFPPSGDFVVEFDLSYDCISDWGSGLWISRGVWMNNGNSSVDVVFQVWADNEASWTRTAIRAYLLGTQVYRSEIPGWEPSADSHTFRLEYIKGVYTVFVDSVEVATESSAIRPDTLGFGHPPSTGIPVEHQRAIGNVGGWSSFRIDFIKVLSPAVVSLSVSASVSQFGFGIDISGILCSPEGTPLNGETIILSYMIPAVREWNPITSAVTDLDGSYVATWLPAATGNFGVKAEWAGNEDFAGTSEVGNISIVRGNGSDYFLAKPNSTLVEASNFTTKQASSSGIVSPLVLLALSLTIASVGLLIHIIKRSLD